MDEFDQHVSNIMALLDSGLYQRVGVYALPGNGKTSVLEKIEQDLIAAGDTNWTVRTEAQYPTPSGNWLMAICGVESQEVFTELGLLGPDMIYSMSYSVGYMEAATGVTFADGLAHNFREYIDVRESMADVNLPDGNYAGFAALQVAIDDERNALPALITVP